MRDDLLQPVPILLLQIPQTLQISSLDQCDHLDLIGDIVGGDLLKELRGDFDGVFELFDLKVTQKVVLTVNRDKALLKHLLDQTKAIFGHRDIVPLTLQILHTRILRFATLKKRIDMGTDRFDLVELHPLFGSKLIDSRVDSLFEKIFTDLIVSDFGAAIKVVTVLKLLQKILTNFMESIRLTDPQLPLFAQDRRHRLQRSREKAQLKRMEFLKLDAS